MAAKVGYAPIFKGKISLPGDSQACKGIYSSPPPPRPLVAHNTLQYDSLPAPREVLPGTVTTSPLEAEILEASITPPSSLSPVLSRIRDVGEGSTDSQEIPSSPSQGTLSDLPSSPAPSPWTENRESEKQEESYLDMNVLNDGGHRKVHGKILYELFVYR